MLLKTRSLAYEEIKIDDEAERMARQSLGEREDLRVGQPLVHEPSSARARAVAWGGRRRWWRSLAAWPAIAAARFCTPS